MLPNIAWTEPQQYSILCVFAVVLLWWCGCLATKGLHEQPREAQINPHPMRVSLYKTVSRIDTNRMARLWPQRRTFSE